jgi:hypothetical protein
VSLPLFPHMTDDQVAAVCGAVAGWDRGRGDGAR